MRSAAAPRNVFLSVHNSIPLHQLDPLFSQLDGAGGAVVRAGLLLAGIVRNALHPRDRQQVRTLFEIGIAALQILPLGEYRAQNAAFFTGAAGLDGVQRDGGGMEARQVVGAVHAAAEGVVQQRLYVDAAVPRRRQVKFDAEIVSRDAKRRRGEGRRVDALTLLVQALPVDLHVIRPRPQANVAKLPQADAAAHEMLVGVQDQVQQVLVGRHGEKAVGFDGIDVGEEVVQIIMSVLRGIKQMPVQLDVKQAALFCVRHLVRRRQLVRRRIGGQTVRKKLFVAGHELAVWNQKIVVRADAVVGLRIQSAAKLPFDHNGMKPRRTQFAIEVGKLRRAHGLIQHLPDDLLLGHSEQHGVLPGGRRCAGSLKEDRQQLLLPRQRENGRPVHLFGGQISTGDGSFGDMQELCFGGGQGHVRVPNPFSGFFDGVGDEQRGGTDERAQGVADHVVRLRKPQRAAVLGVLNSRAEDAADERCEDDSAPTVPLLRQGIRERQPQREEEKDVHQHLAVEFRLLLGGGEGGKRGEDELVVARCAIQNGGVEDGYDSCTKQHKICHRPPA